MYRLRLIGLTLVLTLGTQVLWAQPKGYSPVLDRSPLEKTLNAMGGNLQSIQADFEQVRRMSLLADEVKSKGKLAYASPGRIRLEYLQPFYHLVVIDGSQIWIRDEKKTNRIPLRQQPALRKMNQMIMDCLQGSVFSNPDFEVKAYENTVSYALELIPREKGGGPGWDKILMILDKESGNLEQLKLMEEGGDFTRMDLKNIRRNAPVDDALFHLY